MSNQRRIPQHIAIIMDGNGRWAEKRSLARQEGHVRGVEAVRTTIRAAVEYGVKYLTLYAFSTENWGRPTEEVDALMDLFCRCVASETPELKQQGVKVCVIGERSRFSAEVRESLAQIEQQTCDGEALTLLLALNYSSRCEITTAVAELVRRAALGGLQPDEVSEQTITDALWTAGVPDPDLIVRTGGEQRLSNFLLWQASYAELCFPEVLWPDFTREEFGKVVDTYAQRHRRFGLVK